MSFAICEELVQPNLQLISANAKGGKKEIVKKKKIDPKSRRAEAALRIKRWPRCRSRGRVEMRREYARQLPVHQINGAK